MTDNDPRLVITTSELPGRASSDFARTRGFTWPEYRRLRDENEQLRAQLAADRAAGIVRVDTTDEALARWLGRYEFPAPGGLPGYFTLGFESARAVLAALRKEEAQ